MAKFNKQEHLCNPAEINQLFSAGNPVFKHPVKLLWLPGNWEGKPMCKVLISVPKRTFRKATDRNYIKRLLRECFRINKVILEEGLPGKNCYLALVFAGKEIPDFKSLEPIINKLLHRLIKEYEKAAG